MRHRCSGRATARIRGRAGGRRFRRRSGCGRREGGGRLGTCGLPRQLCLLGRGEGFSFVGGLWTVQVGWEFTGRCGGRRLLRQRFRSRSRLRRRRRRRDRGGRCVGWRSVRGVSEGRDWNCAGLGC